MFQSMAFNRRKKVEEHKATFDPSNIRDLIDAYLLEIKERKERGEPLGTFTGKLSTQVLV
jgi:26-hydroxylase